MMWEGDVVSGRGEGWYKRGNPRCRLPLALDRLDEVLDSPEPRLGATDTGTRVWSWRWELRSRETHLCELVGASNLLRSIALLEHF